MLFSGTLLTGCSSFFYYPSTQSFYSPQRVNLHEQDVFFKDSLNDSIHAWWFAAKTKEAKGTIVFFHGNAENITTHFLMLYWLPEAGYNYLIFDYPGYGISSGKPNQENTVAAGIAAVQWVHDHKDARPLIIYGHSLGGNIALRATELVKDRVPLRNVIIEASFPSYTGMASSVLRRSWITWLLSPLGYVLVSNEGAPRDIAGISPIPLLFIHGDADPVIEVENSKHMFATAKQPKQLWIVPGGHHGDTYFLTGAKYRDLLLNYLDKTKPAS
jgi:alpha-beta hydrolase superfamily lysophospholipase